MPPKDSRPDSKKGGFEPLRGKEAADADDAADDADDADTERDSSIYNDEPAGAVGLQRRKPKRTKNQEKWRKLFVLSLVSDLAVSVMIYESTHNFDAQFDGAYEAFSHYGTE